MQNNLPCTSEGCEKIVLYEHSHATFLVRTRDWLRLLHQTGRILWFHSFLLKEHFEKHADFHTSCFTQYLYLYTSKFRRCQYLCFYRDEPTWATAVNYSWKSWQERDRKELKERLTKESRNPVHKKSGEDGEKGHTSGRMHTNTLTQPYTHVPLCHTHKYIERYLYTYDTSYLAQACQLSTNCSEASSVIRSSWWALFVDKVLLINTRCICLCPDTFPRLHRFCLHDRCSNTRLRRLSRAFLCGGDFAFGCPNLRSPPNVSGDDLGYDVYDNLGYHVIPFE